MAFNPYGYQNLYYPQPVPDNLAQYRQNQMIQQNPIAQGGVQWVSGEQDARNWMIAPNSAVALWDSTAPTVYLKQADASGKPSLKIYDLVERIVTPAAPSQNQAGEYVTRKEFDALVAAVGELKREKDVKEEIING